MKHITHITQNNRTILSRTKTLFRFLGLGHMRGVGMDLPYRQRFQFLLELIYGDTFKPKAFWARHPDPDEFFYALFRVAKPDLPRTAFVGDVFELSAETLHNEVNALALGRLGVSSEQLLRLFQHNAAVEHPQEQGKEKGKWVRVVDSTLPAEVKTGAEGKTTLFVPTPTEETEYRPNIPNGWRPGPTRGKRDRGSKGHSGVFLTQQALKAVGENAPVISPGVNTKHMEQRRAFIANGKVDAPVTAATKKKDTNGKGKNAGSNTTVTTSTAATTTTTTTTTAKGTKRPRSTKAGTQASKRGGGGGGGGSGMLDGLVAAALLSEMDNQKEEEEQKEKKAREKEEKQRANASKKETGEKQPKSKLEKLMLEHLKKETGDGSNIKNAKDEKARSNDENHNGNVKKSDQHALSKKEESASPNGGRGGGRGGAPLEEEDFDDAIPTLPLDDDDLDTWERFDAWRAPLEEDDADCRAKHRTDTDRIEDVYSMFDQVVNDLRSPPSSQQQHQLTNNQTVLRDATSRAQKLLGIEYVLKGMSGDLEQCLDDDETLHMAKHHLAKISEIISRKMNQQLG